MQLNKTILEVLKNFANINSSILLKPGYVLNTKSINNGIYAEYTFEEPIDVDVGVYNIQQMLTAASILSEAELRHTAGEDSMLLTNAKGGKFGIKVADPSTVVAPKKRLPFPVADTVFDMSQEMMSDIKKSAAALSLNVLSFTTDADKIVAKVIGENVDNFAEFPIADYDGNADFTFQMDISNIKIMDGDYKVAISKLGAIKFEGVTLPVSYIMPLNAGGKYQERNQQDID